MKADSKTRWWVDPVIPCLISQTVSLNRRRPPKYSTGAMLRCIQCTVYVYTHYNFLPFFYRHVCVYIYYDVKIHNV